MSVSAKKVANKHRNADNNAKDGANSNNLCLCKFVIYKA